MKQLEFEENSHKYFLNGKPLPSVTEIVEILTASKYSVSSEVLSLARIRGTMVHEACESLDYGMELVSFPPEFLGYITAYQRFLRDYSPKWEYIEVKFGSETEEFAGTIDRVGVIDQKRAIVDLKTTSTMDRKSKIALACQLEAYRRLLHENTGIYADYTFGVQLMRNGEYGIHMTKDNERRYGFSSSDLWKTLRNIYQTIGGK